MGTVHHSRYAVYFEMGRTELLRVNGQDYRTLEDTGVMLVIAKMECRFRSPARYDDQLLLTTTCPKADRVKLQHDYKLERPVDNQLIAQASTILVHIDKNGRLQPLPKFLAPNTNFD